MPHVRTLQGVAVAANAAAFARHLVICDKKVGVADVLRNVMRHAGQHAPCPRQPAASMPVRCKPESPAPGRRHVVLQRMRTLHAQREASSLETDAAPLHQDHSHW
jgi:hypothetical protein